MKRLCVVLLIAIFNISMNYCFASDIALYNNLYSNNLINSFQLSDYSKTEDKTNEIKKSQTPREKFYEISGVLALSSYITIPLSTILIIPGAVDWATKKHYAKEVGMYLCISGISLFVLAYILMIPYLIMSSKTITKSSNNDISLLNKNVGFDFRYSADTKKYCFNISYYF
jgi:hypothetical protein